MTDLCRRGRTDARAGSVFPRELQFEVTASDGAVLGNGSFVTVDVAGNYQSAVAIAVKQLKLTASGGENLTASVWTTAVEDEQQQEGSPAGNATATQTTRKSVASMTAGVFVSPGWVSLLPPLVTLGMSALLGQVMVALLAGIWCGAAIVEHGDVFAAFLRTFDKYWVDAFTLDDHAGVLLFTIVLGGTIGVVQKGGGGHGLALLAKEYMTSSLRMQLATWLLCLVIFFDDYSCILIIGSSLRQVLTQTGVSHEKFAAIIHTIGVCLPSMCTCLSVVISTL